MNSPETVNFEAVTSLFLSPHLDDVVFSCGGLVAQLTANGEQVVVVTCCSEGPQPGEEMSDVIRALHKVWKMETDEAVAQFWNDRHEEDAAAVLALGARYVWLGYRDAIYRGGLYYSHETVMNHVRPGDWPVVEELSARVVELWRVTPHAKVYMPLGIGNHVDHQFTFMVTAGLRAAGAELWHYEDFPYVAREPRALGLRLAELGAPYRSRIVDITDHIDRRIAATALYASQIEPTFGKIGPYREVIMRYAASIASKQGRYAERLWSLDRDGR